MEQRIQETNNSNLEKQNTAISQHKLLESVEVADARQVLVQCDLQFCRWHQYTADEKGHGIIQLHKTTL